MEDFVYYGMLFDIYKDLLSESSKDYFSLYYEENLTLQEIADLKKVSKSYVGNIIKKATKKLNELENTLHILKTNKVLDEVLKLDDIEKIRSIIREIK